MNESTTNEHGEPKRQLSESEATAAPQGSVAFISPDAGTPAYEALAGKSRLCVAFSVL